MVLLEYILGYFSFNIVELTDGHGVRDFDVYGSNLSIWSIVVDDKIIGAAYALCLTDGISDGLRDFRVNPFSENLAYGIAQHIDTGFDDHSGDKGAEPCLQADVEQEIDGGSGQGGGGDDGVIERIASGGYQRVRLYLRPLFLYKFTKDNLRYDGNGDDQQGGGGIIRSFGMQDLFYGFDERRNAGIEHNHGDDHGAQIFNSAVTERVFLVRLLSGQFCSQDCNNG